MDAIAVWDVDLNGNVEHIRRHDLTIEEVESVLSASESEEDVSRSSGHCVVFGWTDTGRYIIVVYEVLADEYPGFIRVVTAYDVSPPEDE